MCHYLSATLASLSAAGAAAGFFAGWKRARSRLHPVLREVAFHPLPLLGAQHLPRTEWEPAGPAGSLHISFRVAAQPGLKPLPSGG